MTMENRFCTGCGTPLSGHVFCSNCGTKSGNRCERNDFAPRGNDCSPPHIPDYPVWSVVSALYAGVFGIVALIFSIMCRSDMSAGRYDSAAQNSNLAFWFNAIPLGILVCAVVSIALFFLVAALAHL